MLQLETQSAGERSAALAGAPIEVRSALNRTSSTPLSPTLGGRSVEVPAPEKPSRDEDRPDWPPPEVEAAMSAEAAERDSGGGGRSAPVSRRVREEAETLDGGPLPSLDELIKLVPADLQEQLDDLFRAKFQAVRRVPAAVLKANQEEAPKLGDAPDDEPVETDPDDGDDDNDD